MNYVQLINDDERVLAAAPSVEFDAALQPREFENIVEDLKSELPVIAWSSLGSNDDEAPHAVIVTGVSTSREEITYNCPVRGRRTTPSKPFLDTLSGAVVGHPRRVDGGVTGQREPSHIQHRREMVIGVRELFFDRLFAA